MINRIKNSKITPILLILLATLAVYGIFFWSVKYFEITAKGVQIRNYSSVTFNQVEEFDGEDMTTEFRVDESVPAASKEISVLETSKCDKETYEILFFATIPWNDDYYDTQSEIYQHLSSLISTEIEDNFDRIYDAKKSISVIEVIELKKLDFGTSFRIKVQTLTDDVKEADLKKGIQSNDGKVVERIVRELRKEKA